MLPTHTFALPDGRQGAYCDGGDPDGYPVIGLHGTPGCRFSRWYDDSVYARAGVRYVTPDRAGYGQAARHPGRTVADEAVDVLALANELGLDRFGVRGGSGGGPRALACAAAAGAGGLLAGRVERVVCEVGPAPYGAGGLPHAQWLNGQTAGNVEEVEWALAGEDALVKGLTGRQNEMAEQLAADPGTAFGEDVADPDREFLARPKVVRLFQRITAEQAAHGVYGWADDMLSVIRPWDFDLSGITVPVLISYGLADTLVPPQHGHWLAAHVPGAQVEVSEQGGHLYIDPEAEIMHALHWLRDAVG